MNRFFVFIIALFPLCNLYSQNYLKNFPIQADPTNVGKRLSNRLMETEHLIYGKKYIHYAEVCTWYGAVRFAEVTQDKELLENLKNRFEPLFTTEKNLLPTPTHVDHNMLGCLPLILYRLTDDIRYKELGLPYADSQWILPQNAKDKQREWHEKGYSWQTRLWIDDMYMITILQSEAYKVTGNKEYIDRAAKEMVLYLDELQHSNGLFYHAPDVPYYWGRGDGWMAVGMTELLVNLPKGNLHYARILKGYRLMMENLKKHINYNGLWNQLIDEPDCWTETSGSAMFTYSMILGIKNGWLDESEYGPIVRRAWMSLCNYIDDNNDLTEVCIGTGKENSKPYYINRPRISGDYHGQAPIIWCAYALIE